MTPGARVAAAISVLEDYLEGTAAEKALTNWGRRSRFAGSKDRAAVRDLVFDALRRRRSCGGLSDGTASRLWVAAVLKVQGQSLEEHFNGVGHAPGALTREETALLAGLPSADPDLPAWAMTDLVESHGADQATAIAQTLQTRAPITLRVNLRKGSLEQAKESLAGTGISCRTTDVCETALVVTENPRRVQSSEAYVSGLVEIQDANSQAITALVPVEPNQRVLDYCAGGGGKTLAMAGRVQAQWFAHDAAPKRLAALGERSKRAGIKVTQLASDAIAQQAPFDVVVCDVPCSGSGAWRRSPAAKWDTASSDVDGFSGLQRQICAEAFAFVKPGGVFAYFTCSIFDRENTQQRDWILQQMPDAQIIADTARLPDSEGDGFYAFIVRFPK